MSASDVRTSLRWRWYSANTTPPCSSSATSFSVFDPASTPIRRTEATSTLRLETRRVSQVFDVPAMRRAVVGGASSGEPSLERPGVPLLPYIPSYEGSGGNFLMLSWLSMIESMIATSPANQ